MLIHEVFSGNARRHPERTGWHFRGRDWTWAEIEERINRCANALLALGLTAGDRVGVFSDNSNQLAELYFAIAKVGMVAVPVNPKSVRPEVEYILEDVGARALLVSERFVERVQGLETQRPGLILLGVEASCPLPDTIEARMAAAPATPPECATDPDAIRAIKYTSGTTGKPKGCISTQRQFQSNLLSYLIHRPFEPEDICLLPLPMSAGVGVAMLYTYCYIAAKTIIMERFNAAQALDLIQEHKVTRFYAIPTMLAAMAEEQEQRPRDLSSLKAVGYGGQASPVALIVRAMNALGCDFYQTFGASEMGGFVTYLMPEDHRAIRDGRLSGVDELGRSIVPCGRDVQGYHVRIVDEQRQEVADGEIGEIAVRCDTLMSGYWNRPEATAEVIADGWLYSGDLGRKSADGLVYLVDRKRDMIVSGGYNVYSAEVESVIHDHPAILEAAVIGVPDPYWGERVQAYVVLRAKAQATEEELLRFVEARLASYKRPKRFIFVNELPRTNTGKLRKVDLRQAAEG